MKLSSFRRNECGAAMVEFAVVLPVLLLLVFGIIDLGRLVYAYNNLTLAVRQGARLAAVQQDPTTGASRAAVRDTVRQYAQPFGTAALQTDAISVTADATPPLTQFVTVAITNNYPFTWLTPLPTLAGLASVNRTWPSATFRWEGAR